MAEEASVQLHIRIQGRVQGVGFRYFVQRSAIDNRITGWTRNRWDGSVEVLAEGPRSRLEIFLVALKRGPSGAFVSDLDFSWHDASGQFTQFSIRRTD